jgi:pre-mRNA-splicing factor ATP-dependent RNA helicase DHX15/PRP43
VVDKEFDILASASAVQDMENPYLAHLSDRKKGAASENGVHPLHGWTPRKVRAEQVRRAMDGDVNPFTKRPVSATYKKIMEARKKLPVYGHMDEFYEIVSALHLKWVDNAMY